MGAASPLNIYPIGYISDGVACVGLAGALGAICNGLLSGRETILRVCCNRAVGLWENQGGGGQGNYPISKFPNCIYIWNKTNEGFYIFFFVIEKVVDPIV